MFMIILYAFIAILAVLLVVIVMQPKHFRVTRSMTISAPSSAIFPQVNNLQKFNVWNPWAKLDPNAKNTFEGPAEGVGSVMRWEGNNEVGSGNMTLIESRPNEFIKFRMEFLKPMQITQTAEFTFKSEGSKTLVTWTIHGKNNFMGKAMGLVFNCDKMVGGQFEKGLATLKTLVEN